MKRINTKWPLGTLVNMGAVALGSIIGLLLQGVLTEGMQTIVFQAIGLGTLLIGFKMMFKLPEGYMLIFIFSLILGGLLGESIQLEMWINGLSDQLKSWIDNEDAGFTEGLITAFLLFCIGSMTILGSLEEGIKGDRELVYIKSLLDGFSSIALASTFGIGVLFSIIPMFFVQGGITLFARRINTYLNEELIDAMSAVGGALIVGISILLMKLGEISLYNLLPSLVVVILLSKSYQIVLKTKSDKRVL